VYNDLQSNNMLATNNMNKRRNKLKTSRIKSRNNLEHN